MQKQMQKRTFRKLRATGLWFTYLIITICGLVSSAFNVLIKTNLQTDIAVM